MEIIIDGVSISLFDRKAGVSMNGDAKKDFRGLKDLYETFY